VGVLVGVGVGVGVRVGVGVGVGHADTITVFDSALFAVALHVPGAVKTTP
jgi:hypothetical protein